MVEAIRKILVKLFWRLVHSQVRRAEPMWRRSQKENDLSFQ
jgi:hypothetical protein